MKKETTTKHRLSMLQSSIILSVLLVSKAPVGANAFVPGWTSMTPTSTSTLPKSTTTTTTTTTSTPTFVHRGRSRPRPAKISSDNEWGIPDSDTLEPLSTTVRDELPNGGCVTLVGSGPGDPDLLTVAAYKILADPDNLVIADRLVSKEILDLIGGEIKVARKLPGCAELAQEEIYSWAHEGLKEGRHVVRLKIGDPFVFGRGGEEVLKFRYFGVEPTVIPVRIWMVDVDRRNGNDSDCTCCRFVVDLTNPIHLCRFTGCFSGVFGTVASFDSGHTQRCVEPSGHVHRVRSGGDISGSYPVSQRADHCLFDGRRPTP